MGGNLAFVITKNDERGPAGVFLNIPQGTDFSLTIGTNKTVEPDPVKVVNLNDHYRSDPKKYLQMPIYDLRAANEGDSIHFARGKKDSSATIHMKGNITLYDTYAEFKSLPDETMPRVQSTTHNPAVKDDKPLWRLNGMN